MHILRQVELKVQESDANLISLDFLVAGSGSVRQEASRMLSPPPRQVNGIPGPETRKTEQDSNEDTSAQAQWESQNGRWAFFDQVTMRQDVLLSTQFGSGCAR